MRRIPLKGLEKIAQPHSFFRQPLKGFLLSLGILATHKHVTFFNIYLVGHLIFLQLVLDIF